MTWGQISMMSRGLVSMVILLLWIRETDGGDLQVTCGFSGDCVLPCSFQPGSEEVILWVKLKHIPVHSYYYSTDQLEQQDQQYRQRTSLYKDQIPKGNASLLLRSVRVQDQGRYQCYTSTVKDNQESFINITVKAPVRLVDIHLSDDIITCSSTDIYPEPKLTWSTAPPSDLLPDHGTAQSSTSTSMNEQGLYDITSTIPFIRDQTNICTVISGKTKKTTTLRQQASVRSLTSSEVSIWCSVLPSDLLTSNITWRFNQKGIILTSSYTNDIHQMHVEDPWKEHVKDVSDSLSLRLYRLTMNHQGNYSCEVSTDRHTHLVLTYLEITPDEIVTGLSSQINAAVLTGVLLAVAVVAGVYMYIRGRKKNSAASNKTTPATKKITVKQQGSPKTASNQMEGISLWSETQSGEDPTNHL